MTRLKACIDALEDNLWPEPLVCPEYGRENALTKGYIATITRILSAEPTSEEIERIAETLAPFLYDLDGTDLHIRAARAALLTAFPQQETKNDK